jgi:hypothetical protein
MAPRVQKRKRHEAGKSLARRTDLSWRIRLVQAREVLQGHSTILRVSRVCIADEWTVRSGMFADR